MNKKGFTLVELLAVIAILGIVVTIGVVGIGNLTEKGKEKMLDEKIRFIEESATLYGEDMRGAVINSVKKYQGRYSCISIKVNDLVPEYLDSDRDLNDCTFYFGYFCQESTLEYETDEFVACVYPTYKSVSSKEECDLLGGNFINNPVMQNMCSYYDVENISESDKMYKSDFISTECIVDPSSDTNYLDNYNVIIYYRNNRINAKFDKNNDLSCS